MLIVHGVAARVVPYQVIGPVTAKFHYTGPAGADQTDKIRGLCRRAAGPRPYGTLPTLPISPSARCVQDRGARTSVAPWSGSRVPPANLEDDCRLLSDVGRRPLRSNSNDMQKLLVPRTHNKLGDRSFSAAGTRLWNDLPPGLRRPGLTFDSFRQSLKKTHSSGDRSA